MGHKLFFILYSLLFASCLVHIIKDVSTATWRNSKRPHICRVKVIFGLKQASEGGLGIWLRCLLLTSLWRYSGHAQLGGDPGADPEHTRGISCPIWHRNASGCPKRSWRMWLKKWMSMVLCLVCCNWDQGPGSAAGNGSFWWKSWRYKSLVGLLKVSRCSIFIVHILLYNTLDHHMPLKSYESLLSTTYRMKLRAVVLCSGAWHYPCSTVHAKNTGTQAIVLHFCM